MDLVGSSQGDFDLLLVLLSVSLFCWWSCPPLRKCVLLSPRFFQQLLVLDPLKHSTSYSFCPPRSYRTHSTVSVLVLFLGRAMSMFAAPFTEDCCIFVILVYCPDKSDTFSWVPVLSGSRFAWIWFTPWVVHHPFFRFAFTNPTQVPVPPQAGF